MSGFVTVSVRQGALRGRRRRTPSGNAFLSFQGIPYARPPLGSLRFKAPLPPESWTGIRDATKEGKQCVQFDMITRQFVGDEDCLVLNVFTPRLPTGKSDDKPLAVLVWIHGGAFVSGSSDMYGPEPLMDQGVVLVTINYRLGPLGFLSLGTAEAPGNAGLKDQTMALRWVKENVALFGGDPDNVTIFGESAGGASVHYHVLSPLSKGLFRRAIAQSGSALCPWALSRDPAGRAQRLALVAGCDYATTEEPRALLKWFREVSPMKLVESLDAALTPEERRRGLLASFVPCVEPPHAEAFLPDDPAALLANGSAQRVPIMFGLTSHEGILMLPGSLLRLGHFRPPSKDAPTDPEVLAAVAEEMEAKTLAEIACDLERLLPEELLAGKRDPQRSQQLTERLKDFYLDGKELSEDTLDGFVHLNSDLQFSLGVLRAARDHARLGAHVYLYEFAFDSAANFLSKLLDSKVKGVCHADELGYQFNLPFLPEPEEGSPEALTRRRMGRLWTDFARGGIPTPSLDDDITATWLPFTESAPNYFRISEDLIADTGLLKERMLFWKDLFSK